MKAALALIDQHGIKGFSLKDAAALAGVSTAAPYRHFADKAALLFALKNEGFRLFNAALTEGYARGAESEGGPARRIVELGVAYVAFALHNPAHFRVMFGLVGGVNPEPDPEQSDGFLLLVKAVDELVPNLSPEERKDRVLASWSLVHGFALLQLEGVFAATLPIENVEQQLRRTLAVIAEPHS